MQEKHLTNPALIYDLLKKTLWKLEIEGNFPN